MMASILLNPQLMIYSTALGMGALAVRIVSCSLCGVTAGLLVHFFYKDKPFFNFDGFHADVSRDTDPHLFLRFCKNFGRNVKATGIYFLAGVLLSALFQRYVPSDQFAELFGKRNEGFGVLMAATIGVPLYVCGGGTIPLLRAWLYDGMSMGSAAAFMITGPATKITNLGAMKIVLGKWKFGAVNCYHVNVKSTILIFKTWRSTMKKILAGIGFEITGVLMLLFSSLIASMSLENTTEWNTQLGRFWQTVSNLGLFPVFVTGAILLITGIAFSLWGVFSKSDK